MLYVTLAWLESAQRGRSSCRSFFGGVKALGDSAGLHLLEFADPLLCSRRGCPALQARGRPPRIFQLEDSRKRNEARSPVRIENSSGIWTPRLQAHHVLDAVAGRGSASPDFCLLIGCAVLEVVVLGLSVPSILFSVSQASESCIHTQALCSSNMSLRVHVRGPPCRQHFGAEPPDAADCPPGGSRPDCGC